MSNITSPQHILSKQLITKPQLENKEVKRRQKQLPKVNLSLKKKSKDNKKKKKSVKNKKNFFINNKKKKRRENVERQRNSKVMQNMKK